MQMTMNQVIVGFYGSCHFPSPIPSVFFGLYACENWSESANCSVESSLRVETARVLESMINLLF